MASHAPRVQVPEVLKRRKCFIHIDLEQIRLGLTADVPLVSQQWNAIIAVNYAARKYGITRLHHNVFDAKQLCPDLVCAHVATLAPGDSKPDYYPSPSRYTHKVSLDPYRKASARIFSVFQKFNVKYQKGGLDEVFMDVTDIVNQRIMDEYGQDLSKWDRDSAEKIDWQRDHPEAGVVFGMLKRDDGYEEVNRSGFLSSDEDEDDDEGRARLEGMDAEEDHQEMGSDRENEMDHVDHTENEAGTEQALEDDFGFDIDLEQYLDEFNDSFSLSHQNTSSDSKNAPSRAITELDGIAEQPTAGSLPAAEEVSQSSEDAKEELKREKEAEEERLRLELEQLLPYYGIPEDAFEEGFWAEMQLLKAAEFCREVRFAVKEELGYTCSAGIGNNRLIAKIGSGLNKPFNQTIVLPKYVPNLLHGLKLNKIRNLGGKFGKQVKDDYKVERASQLWPVPLRQLQQRYGEQAGLELWQWCRGIDHVGILKIKSKSMCSHKSFIPALSDLEEIQFWITSMSLEIVSRMQAEYEETERWPRTISLGFFGGFKARQDQIQGERKSSFRPPHKGTRSMPLGSRFEYGGVEGITKKMYAVVERLVREADTGRGRPILPLVLLTITVSNFSALHESAMGDITKFFSRKPIPVQQSALLAPSALHSNEGLEEREEGEEKMNGKEEQIEIREHQASHTISSERSTENQARRRFFQPRQAGKIDDNPSSNAIQHLRIDQQPVNTETSMTSSPVADSRAASPEPNGGEHDVPDLSSLSGVVASATLLCEQCPSPGQHIAIEEWEQHTDYHFALGLLEDDRKQQQIERQQQQRQQQQQASSSRGTDNRPQGHACVSKRGASSSSSSSSSSTPTRGKRKKVIATSAPLAKFFKPAAN
ncbi:DNA-directed DNA polymerase eta rad30 [Mortierella claussenii]|nr:DNA-directed DNA polymerase eta rad30 [Mortierella claussenii]